MSAQEVAKLTQDIQDLKQAVEKIDEKMERLLQITEKISKDTAPKYICHRCLGPLYSKDNMCKNCGWRCFSQN